MKQMFGVLMLTVDNLVTSYQLEIYGCGPMNERICKMFNFFEKRAEIPPRL
jgi:hypothetical protein